MTTSSDDDPDPIVRVVARPDDEIAGEFVDALVARDVERRRIVVERPASPDEMIDLGRRWAGDDVPIAVVGGDGSFNLVAGELVGTSTPVLSVPAGTVNLVANVFGTGDLETAVAALRAGRPRRLDVGENDDGIFVLNATSGWDAAVIGEADDHSDARFGRLRFARVAVRRLRRDRPRRLTVVVDGDTRFVGRATSVMVLNLAQRASAAIEVVPGARPDDGILDVVVVKLDSIPAAVRAAWRILRGPAPDRADAVTVSGREIELRWSDPVAIQRDGDLDGHRAHQTLRVRPAALSVLVHPDNESSR